MADTMWQELSAIRDLLSADRLDEATSRLRSLARKRKSRSERGLYYLLQARIDLIQGVYRTRNINLAINSLNGEQPSGADRELYLLALLLKGILLFKGRRWRQGRTLFLKAAAAASKAGERYVEATALGQLAWDKALRGRFRDADQFFERAIELYDQIGHDQHRRAMIHNRSFWRARYGRFREGMSGYLGDPVSVEESARQIGALCWVNQAFVLTLQFRTEEALDALDKYRKLCRGNVRDDLLYMINSGIARAAVRDYESALQDLFRALELSRRLKTDTLATVYQYLAECYLGMQQFAEAAAYARRAIRQANRYGEVLVTGAAYRTLGVATAHQPKPRRQATARHYILQSLRIFGRIDARWDLAMTQLEAGHLDLFDFRQKRQLVRLAHRYFDRENLKCPGALGYEAASVAEGIKNADPGTLDALKRLLDLD